MCSMSASFIRSIEASLRLLFHLILSQERLKNLASHIGDRPVARDYLVAGVGRIACTEVPDWLEDKGDLAQQLDQLASKHWRKSKQRSTIPV
jgi:hypothetical protein